MLIIVNQEGPLRKITTPYLLAVKQRGYLKRQQSKAS
jgi:hypothetical protein